VRGLPAYGVQRRANNLGVLRQRDAGGDSSSSSLLTGLVSYWKLDEASGTRFDTVSSNNLSDNGGVGSAIGKIGNAAEFDTTNYLSTNTVLSSGPFTVSCWIYADTVTQPAGGIVNRYSNSVPADRTWTTYVANDDIVFGVLPTSLTVSNVVSAATWHLFIFWYDDVAQEIGIQFDTTIQTTPQTTGYPVTNVDFTVGARSGGNTEFDGRIDEVGIWSRVLTAAERTQLYNGGSGITYPFSS
jgi:hypothetical protein